jgi:hypothetical protein
MDNHLDQDSIFNKEEANNWFHRNKAVLGKEPDWVPWILDHLDPTQPISSVL